MKLRMSMSTEEIISGGSPSTATSPVNNLLDDPLQTVQQQQNTYMNVTPGEMILMQQAAGGGSATGSLNMRYSRMNSNASTTTSMADRCYENLDPSVLNAVLQGGPLVNSTSTHGFNGASGVVSSGSRGGRHSKPDIFSKVDLPMIDGAMRMSEPCTPTMVAGLASQQKERKVNYIVLDLDSNNISGSSSMNNNNNSSSSSSNNNSNQSGPGGGSNNSNALTTPESPTKKAINTTTTRETFGYATIDFNKTVALSNSTNPTESEASRKTRF